MSKLYSLLLQPTTHITQRDTNRIHRAVWCIYMWVFLTVPTLFRLCAFEIVIRNIVRWILLWRFLRQLHSDSDWRAGTKSIQAKPINVAYTYIQFAGRWERESDYKPFSLASYLYNCHFQRQNNTVPHRITESSPVFIGMYRCIQRYTKKRDNRDDEMQFVAGNSISRSL